MSFGGMVVVMNKDEALKLALEALERYQVKRQDFERFADVITAIKEALAQPERHWVGLTDKEANELWESTDSDWELMKRTEFKLKEKNR